MLSSFVHFPQLTKIHNCTSGFKIVGEQTVNYLPENFESLRNFCVENLTRVGFMARKSQDLPFRETPWHCPFKCIQGLQNILHKLIFISTKLYFIHRKLDFPLSVYMQLILFSILVHFLRKLDFTPLGKGQLYDRVFFKSRCINMKNRTVGYE